MGPLPNDGFLSGVITSRSSTKKKAAGGMMVHQGEDPRESEVRQAGFDDEKVFSKSPFPRGLRALSLQELPFQTSLLTHQLRQPPQGS